jgi:probable HAF family extracellular repeat protein
MNESLGRAVFTATVVLSLAPLAVAQKTATHTPSPIDMGTLPGGTSSLATGIASNRMFAVGAADTATGNQHAFRRTGTMLDLGTLPLDPSTPNGNSIANSVTVTGLVAGTSDFDAVDPTTGTVNRYNHAFVFRAGTLNDLGTLGGNLSWGTGITVGSMFTEVGYSTILGEGATHAFSYSGRMRMMTDLGTLSDGSNSMAFAINSTGVVAGSGDSASDGTFHAVTWTGGVIQDLGTLAPGSGLPAEALGINSAGNTVGDGFVFDMDGNPVDHAWVDLGSGLMDIGTLDPTATSAQADAINDNNVVVGTSNTAGDTDTHAFYWSQTAGMMVDLNTLLPAGSPWTLNTATGISADGSVVGTGIINGQSHAYIWAIKLR